MAHPEYQRIVYDQVSTIADTLLGGRGLKIRVTVEPTQHPVRDDETGYDVRVRWSDAETRYGINQTLYMDLMMASRLGIKEYIEGWALHYFAQEIGLWAARQDGIV